MKVSLIWWNLNKSKQTIESLNQYFKEEDLSIWGNIEGLYLKLWIFDRINNLWGAVMLWDAFKFRTELLPPNRAAELIGYPPTSRFVFDIENIVKNSSLSNFLDENIFCKLNKELV